MSCDEKQIWSRTLIFDPAEGSSVDNETIRHMKTYSELSTLDDGCYSVLFSANSVKDLSDITIDILRIPMHADVEYYTNEKGTIEARFNEVIDAESIIDDNCTAQYTFQIPRIWYNTRLSNEY